MKMSDILHSIADMLDQQEGGDISGDNLGKEADDFQHNVNDGASEAGARDAEVGVMMPPLQQELELKKKESEVDNAFDNEMGDIKRLSGITTIIGNTET